MFGGRYGVPMSSKKAGAPANDLGAEYGPVLTPDEVAAILQLTKPHLVNLMRLGKFPAFKVAGAWRVKRSALQAVMDGTWVPEGSKD